jgi:hypothetical protein
MAAPFYIDGTDGSLFHFIDGWRPQHVFGKSNRNNESNNITAIGKTDNMVVIPFQDRPSDWNPILRGEIVNMVGSFYSKEDVAYKVRSRVWESNDESNSGTEVNTRSFYWDADDEIIRVETTTTGNPELADLPVTYEVATYSSALTTSDISGGWGLVTPIPFRSPIAGSSTSGTASSEPTPLDYFVNESRTFYRAATRVRNEEIFNLYSDFTTTVNWIEYEFPSDESSGSLFTTYEYEDQYTGDSGQQSEYGSKDAIDIEDLPWVAGTTTDFRLTTTDPYKTEAPSLIEYIYLPNLNAELDEDYDYLREDLFIPTDCMVGIQFTAATAVAIEDGETNLTIKLSGENNDTFEESEVETSISIPTTSYATDISSTIATLISSFISEYGIPMDGAFGIEVVDGVAGLLTKQITVSKAGFANPQDDPEDGILYATKLAKIEVNGVPSLFRVLRSEYTGEYKLAEWEILDSIETEMSGTSRSAVLGSYAVANGSVFFNSTEEVLVASRGNGAKLLGVGIEVSSTSI